MSPNPSVGAAADPPEPPPRLDRPDAETLLSVRNLSTSFFTNDGVVPAVRDVSFAVRRGEILGLVGESGSGKSMTARSILGLVPRPGRITGGEVWLNGRNLVTASPAELRSVRGAELSMVLQEPMTSLNPVLTIGNQVEEAFGPRERTARRDARRAAVTDVLTRVRIPDAERRQREYPMHFSGGMRQRVSIAIATARTPDLIIADEPTTALDVTIQAQVLDLLLELRDRLNTGLLFITHDLGVIAEICDTVAVMYAGQIVEYADVRSLFADPKHPYTRALLRSLPTVDKRLDRLPSITGYPPDLLDLPAGWPFAARCESAFDQCVVDPPLFEVGGRAGSVGHARCWLHDPAGSETSGREVSDR